MKKSLLILGALSLLNTGKAQTVTFNYTGALDSLQIPNCIDSITINAWGAEGGTTIDGGLPGKGAYISTKMDVTAGQWIYIQVGGQDGYNGGGEGGYGTPTTGIGDYAGNGGGASDVRFGGTTLADRKVVAAGGGGGGRSYVNGSCVPCGVGGSGGDGGVTNGLDGEDAINGGYGANPGGAGKGGTQIAGGDGGLGVEGDPGNPGSLGQGGIGVDGQYSVAGGGGGGGYYGGGSGVNANSSPGSGVAGSGGGGGSSYYDPTVVFVNGLPGIRTGNGQVTITYIHSSPIMTTAVGQSDITLNSLQAGVSYQWLNCGTGYAVVPGATNQSYTATANGSYAVELDNGNGCVDTSACFAITQVSLSEYDDLNVAVYPNPANNQVQVTVNANTTNIMVHVYDAEGRLVLEAAQNNPLFTLNIESLESGVYILQLNADETLVSRIQLIKN
ncbi:MAG: T9SS type A sorting domain-containing protein [Bacteroidetes bacterium]|nr:T9SS type A sorting domain-containing protein [Bacteroidota bacterium]